MPIIWACRGRIHESRSLGGTQVLLCGFVSLTKWQYPNLSAPYWRWYHNDRDGAFILVNKERIPLRAGLVYLIPPNTPFATKNSRPFGHLYTHFSLALDRVGAPGQVLEHHPSPEEAMTIGKLKKKLKSPCLEAELEVSFLAQLLVNWALADVPGRDWRESRSDLRIEQAISILKANSSQTVDNRSLAREANMNVNAFTRRFRQVTGDTPHQYLLRLRTEKAAKWLHDGELSIDEIAERTGFCDRFHFSRSFKRYLGLSPALFRRQTRLEGERT